MGNVLRNPIVEKETEVGTIALENGDRLEWGLSSMQGWRLEQEDAHIVPKQNKCIMIQMQVKGVSPPNNWGETQELQGHYLFAVLDGHGGKFTAKYASHHLCRVLSRQPTLLRYAKLREEQGIGSIEKEEQLQLLKAALRDTFLDLDREIYLEVQKGTPFLDEKGKLESEDLVPPVAECGLRISVPQLPEEDSGSTVALIVLTPESIVCASLGDSRAVLCHQDENREDVQAVPLSRDHKPSCHDEEERILNAGGFVEDTRVDGDVAVSRALGDFRFKNPQVVLERKQSELNQQEEPGNVTSPETQKLAAVPEISVRDRDLERDLFLVCACDGIWDVHTNEECIAHVSEIFNEGETDLGLVCEELLDTSLELGSQDNMTVVILRFSAQAFGEGGGVRSRREARTAKQEKAEEEKRPVS